MKKLFLADLKMLFRNRQASFWALMFPLMFTFIFGFFFSNRAEKSSIIFINQSVTPISQSLEKALTDANILKLDTGTKDESSAKDQLSKGKTGAVLIIPENFGAAVPGAPKSVKLIEDPSNTSVNMILLGFLDKFSTNLTFQLNGIKAPVFSVEEEKINKNDLRYFDFVLAGILGLALMNASIIGVSVGMAKYREDKILKRMTTTPMKSWWFIVAEVASRLVMNFIQVSLILAIGKFVFNAHIYGNILVVYGLALLGGILFQLLGFVIASFVKTTDAAQGAATAITIPMMFLGGVFFPTDTLPKWLYAIVQYLPIAPLLRTIRSVVLEGSSPFANPSNMILVFAWIVVCLLVASWKFRLSED